MGLFFFPLLTHSVSMAPKYEICAGLDKGHKTTPNELKRKPSKAKGKLTNHSKFVRDLIREVAGFSPYDKRCLKFLKKRIGSHILRGREKKCLQSCKQCVN